MILCSPFFFTKGKLLFISLSPSIQSSGKSVFNTYSSPSVQYSCRSFTLHLPHVSVMIRSLKVFSIGFKKLAASTKTRICFHNCGLFAWSLWFLPPLRKETTQNTFVLAQNDLSYFVLHRMTSKHVRSYAKRPQTTSFFP